MKAKNLVEVAVSCDTRKSTVVHKFAQKYGFKGSWDAVGKLVQERIKCLKLKGEQIANIYSCYLKLCMELMKDDSQEEYVKL
eukprot:10534325-Ditylum_brightwellii.AAC.1